MYYTADAGPLVSGARTLDQARALLTFMEAISDKTLRTTVSLTASR
jgi:N-acetyltransferase 10